MIDNLDISKKSKPRYTLEYMTYDPAVLNETMGYPVPHHLLPSQLLNSSTELDNSPKSRSSKTLAPYGLPDLTIPSYLRLARRLGKASGEQKDDGRGEEGGKDGEKKKKKGQGKKKMLWKRFVMFMYMDI